MVGHDAPVAVAGGLLGGAQPEPAGGAGAGQRTAPVALAHAALPGDVVAAHGEREQAVGAQPVVVVEALAPQGEGEQALGEQVPQGVLAAAGGAVIGEGAPS